MNSQTQRMLTLFSLMLLVSVGCRSKNDSQSKRPTENKTDIEFAVVKDIVAVEDVVLDLTPRLGLFSRSLILNGSLFSDFTSGIVDLKSSSRLEALSSEVFENQMESSAGTATPDFVQTASWPIGQPDASPHQTDPWMPFTELMNGWTKSKFGILSGKFTNANQTQFEIKTAFSGSANADFQYSINAVQRLTWDLEPEFKSWKLVKWEQDSFQVARTKQTLFENVTANAIPDPETFESVTRSVHQQYLLNVLRTGITPVYDKAYLPYVDADMNHATPSVSVVDFNNDGWDDLFVSSRWSPPKLLQNNSGEFEDVTEAVGIKIRGLVNCSMFVDIDNDGDQDILIGRSLEPAMLFENLDGVFVDRTAENSDLGDLYFVSAISASDINRDGLIDFYLSTYGAGGDNRPEDWKQKFLPPDQAEALNSKESAGHMWVDFAGPPNVVVMNRGEGRLERVPVDEVVSQWHNSFQSAWADFDGDGDDDLYVCNDFAPGGFLINETPIGSDTPVFTDGISKAFPNVTMGFSMGASWADVDADGDEDLYVSNMYSKAGNRIMNQMNEVDSRFKESAKGNYLYRNDDGNFKQIAGVDKNFPVHKVGWSYGGQFADFTNNGLPDIYVPSGYFTAPEAGDNGVDL